MLPEQKQSDHPVWLQRAIDLFDKDTHEDGDILSHSWIKFALDIPEPRNLADANQAQWVLLTRVESFKDWLLTDRKIALQNVRGEGYRIVPPREQAQVAAEEAMKHVKKGLDKGDKLMTHTRFQELETDERRRHTDAHVRLSGIGDLMRRQKKDMFKLFRQNHEQLSST